MEKKAVAPLLSLLFAGLSGYTGLKSLYGGVTEGDPRKLISGLGELALIPIGIGAMRGSSKAIIEGAKARKELARLGKGSQYWKNLSSEIGSGAKGWQGTKQKYYNMRAGLSEKAFDAPRSVWESFHNKAISPLDRMSTKVLHYANKYTIPFEMNRYGKGWEVLKDSGGNPLKQTVGQGLSNFARNHGVLGGLALPVGLGMATAAPAEQPMQQQVWPPQGYPQGMYYA